jgi:outer membrane protein assembly factor BamA
MWLYLTWLVLAFLLSEIIDPVSLYARQPENIPEKEKPSGMYLLPFMYYSPETRLAIGALLNYYYRAKEDDASIRPSSIMPSVIYTMNKQILLELSGDFYWKQNTYHLSSYLSYQKFPDKFYGIGNDTPASAEEDYTPLVSIVRLNFQKSVRKGLYVGIQYQFEHHVLQKVQEGGQLADGEIPGSEGGNISGAGVSLNWDTRNNIFYPTGGSFFLVSAEGFPEFLGSDYRFNRYIIDLRKYFPTFPRQAFAVQGFFSSVTGNPPFQMLSLLGGSGIMRGYYRGRYRDKKLMAFQTEYRLPLFWRFRAVGFAGMGDVAGKIKGFRWDEFKYSAGFGLRFILSRSEGIAVRLDVGYGKDTSGVYFTINEAF